MARDLGSLNGVFYRGKRLERPTELAFGEEISFAGLNFLVESVDSTTTHVLPGAVPDDSVVILDEHDVGGSSF